MPGWIEGSDADYSPGALRRLIASELGNGGAGTQGPQGDDGLSAYELAVLEGFQGDLPAWLASLEGPEGAAGAQGLPGNPGAPGDPGPQGDPGDPGTNGAQGDDGLSAYEIAVLGGFVGNESAWLASLVGPEGPAGSTAYDPTATGMSAVTLQDAIDEEDLRRFNHVTEDVGAHEANAIAFTPTGSITANNVQGAIEQASSQAGGSPLDAWPVGSVYIGLTSANPATLLGGGTWVAFAAGRVIVGRDAGDPDFDTVRETRGAKTHTLTTAEMPAHTHVLRSQTATTGAATSYEHGTLDTSSAEAEATEVTDSAGGGGAHNNIQPSIVAYIWERTA